MDFQKQDLGLWSSWVLIYLVFMGLFSMILGICIVCLHWRKKLQRERRARQWVQVMTDTPFSYSPLVYWIHKLRSCGMEAAISVGAPPAVSKSEINILIPDVVGDSDTPEGRGYARIDSGLRAEVPVRPPATLDVSQQPGCHRMPQRRNTPAFPSPVFQEIPWAPPLLNPPPLLPHSASYPFEIDPEGNVHFYSLPTLDKGVNSFNAKPSASEWVSPSTEGGSFSYKDY